MNTVTGCHFARQKNGLTNTAAIIPPLSRVTKNSLSIVLGLGVTVLAAIQKQTRKHMAIQQQQKRHDFRQECNQPKVYRCLKAFMGGFVQADCAHFMLDEDGLDKCNYQEFSGECNRGSGLE